jgi:hypothetical protein
MSRTDPRVLDLTAFDRPTDRSNYPEQSDLHLLRLALDLQLDAMLLTLGAAAHAESRVATEPGDRGAVPWQRWLVEDLDLARALAVTLLEGEGAPVPGLGGGFANARVSTSLDNLAARYESMEKLLLGVLGRPTTGYWRPTATEALVRCRARLRELHDHRRAAMADSGAASSANGSAFRPGELLG